MGLAHKPATRSDLTVEFSQYGQVETTGNLGLLSVIFISATVVFVLLLLGWWFGQAEAEQDTKQLAHTSAVPEQSQTQNPSTQKLLLRASPTQPAKKTLPLFDPFVSPQQQHQGASASVPRPGAQHSPLSSQQAYPTGLGLVPGGIPPLCPSHSPTQDETTFMMPRTSFRVLSQRGVVEVLHAGFDYPVAYARLGTGAEGSRLEIASEPSWSKVEVTIGPLDYPAKLSAGASIHGPERELYGPFQRIRTGFAVGHYAWAGNVLTITPKKTAHGLQVDVNSGLWHSQGRQHIAVVTFPDGAQDFRLDVASGVDAFLVIASVLATFVASKYLIDELHTTI